MADKKEILDRYMVYWVEENVGKGVVVANRILSPEKIIHRILDIHDIVFELYQELKESYDLTGHKSTMKEVELEIVDMIEDIRYAQEHYITIYKPADPKMW